MRKYFLAVPILAISFGCASTGESLDPPAYSVIKPGATLQLNEALTIPPHSARVYMQYGKVVPKITVNQYYPSCSLRSYVVMDREQIIHPDRFEISRVSKITELVQASSVLLASRGFSGFNLFNKEGPMAEIFIIKMDIVSNKNPDIKKLECMAWRDPHLGRHLSVADIRQTLGKIIDLKLQAGN